jgi:Mor family transcriptional regulator
MIHMVGVLHAYSKQSSGSVKLRSLMHKIKARPEVARVASPIPRRAKQISPEQSAQLAEGYRQGMKIGELARKYGVHRATVADHLAAHSITKRPRGLTPYQVTEASSRYRAGESLAGLGRSYSVSADTVRKILISSGVRMRNPWDHPRSVQS